MQQFINQLARQQGQTQSTHLVELNAGKMKEVGPKLVADKRKGVILLDKKDGILQICWKQRQAQQNEDEFMLFGDAKWSCIDEKQFIYCLKFDNGTHHFYWIQQFEHQEQLSKLYDLVNGDALKSTEKVVNNNKSTTTANIVKLSDAFAKDQLAPLLANKQVVASLFPFLPQEHTVEQVVESVQFKQSVGSLEHLIQNGHLKDVLQQLGVQHTGNEQGSAAVEAFLNAIKSKYCDEANHKEEEEDVNNKSP